MTKTTDVSTVQPFARIHGGDERQPVDTAHRPTHGGLPDRIAPETLSSGSREALAKSSSRELLALNSARVVTKQDRVEIFRIRLAQLFPHAAAHIAHLELPERHNYFKISAFMATGRWPNGTPHELVQLYPTLMGPILDMEAAAYKNTLHDQIKTLCQARGQQPSQTLIDHVEREASQVCEAIYVAQTQGARSLLFSDLIALPSLPSHITSLACLQELILVNLPLLKALPHDLGKLASLQTLELSHLPKLEALPDSIAQLTNLRKLNLRRLQTEGGLQIPQDMQSLRKLKVIPPALGGGVRMNVPPVHMSTVAPLYADLTQP